MQTIRSYLFLIVEENALSGEIGPSKSIPSKVFNSSIAGFITYDYAYEESDEEKLIAISNLKLREFPAAESQEINMFPFGTRIKVSNDPPIIDVKNRTWNKVYSSQRINELS